MVVLKAIQSGTTAAVTCQLCMRVKELMDSALEKYVPSSAYASDFAVCEVPVMMALDRELYSSLALYMYGKDHFERKEVGTAIGLCKLALKKLETQKGNSFQTGFAGLPPLTVKGRNHLINGIDNFKAVVNDLLVKAENDNIYVYAQIVPKDAELPVLPAGSQSYLTYLLHTALNINKNEPIRNQHDGTYPV